MNDTLIQDTLQMAHQVISQSKEIHQSTNWWMWLSIAEFGVLTYLLIKKKINNNTIQMSAKQKFKKESLEQDIDFDNIINSSFNSNELYDKLKVKCHPDRFPNDNKKNIIAENIFQEITKNKNNVKRLLELKQEAIQKLNINF